MDTGVSVVGSGQVVAAPDLLRISFSVEHVARDVSAAVAQIGEVTDAVIAALVANGIERSAIGTTAVGIYQEYHEHADGPAFRGSHMITARTKDLNGFGRLLNAAVGAAGNDLGLHALEFDIEDKTELITQARALAFRQARKKAEELAGLAGFSLGAVTAISETHGFARAEGVALAAGKGFDSALNVVPGGQNVQVNLEVHFAWA